MTSRALAGERGPSCLSWPNWMRIRRHTLGFPYYTYSIMGPKNLTPWKLTMAMALWRAYDCDSEHESATKTLKGGDSASACAPCNSEYGRSRSMWRHGSSRSRRRGGRVIMLLLLLLVVVVVALVLVLVFVLVSGLTQHRAEACVFCSHLRSKFVRLDSARSLAKTQARDIVGSTAIAASIAVVVATRMITTACRSSAVGLYCSGRATTR